MNKCADAIKDAITYTEEYPNYYMFSIIGVCHYYNKQYSKALDFFKRVYMIVENDFESIKIKEAASYNIAALNAILGNEDEAIKWLKFPLMQDKRLWLEKIKNDNDFDAIRKKEKFINFLKKFE